jgi:hypothetical protein
MSEKKRGRPRKVEISHWDKKYYTLDPKRDNQAVRKVKEERMFKAFEYVHLMANDTELGWFEINIVKKRIGDILDTI